MICKFKFVNYGKIERNLVLYLILASLHISKCPKYKILRFVNFHTLYLKFLLDGKTNIFFKVCKDFVSFCNKWFSFTHKNMHE